MPRRRAAPRLYLDPGRGQWVIRDGPSFIRTGCVADDRSGAEKQLAAYLGQKHEPERGPDPLIADVLLVYAQEHVPHTRAARNTAYNITSLVRWWGDRRVSYITAGTCRQYQGSRGGTAVRRDLEVLRAACGYWQRERGSFQAAPGFSFPAKNERRDRWITRSEAAGLLRAARTLDHLGRFILLAIYTGSRSGVLLRLTWDQIDLASGVMSRRPAGEPEDARKRTPRVRLGRRILGHLRRWKKDDSCPYVIHWNGKPLTRMQHQFRRAVDRAGLKGVTPHTLRHTRATWLMQSGVPIWEAAGHLGMTIQTLERTYGHHHPDWQRRAAEV